jgi:hypothetical protein
VDRRSRNLGHIIRPRSKVFDAFTLRDARSCPAVRRIFLPAVGNVGSYVIELTGLASEIVKKCRIFYRGFAFSSHEYKSFKFICLELAERGIRSLALPLDSVSYRNHIAGNARNASVAVGPCPFLPVDAPKALEGISQSTET